MFVYTLSEKTSSRVDGLAHFFSLNGITINWEGQKVSENRHFKARHNVNKNMITRSIQHSNEPHAILTKAHRRERPPLSRTHYPRPSPPPSAKLKATKTDVDDGGAAQSRQEATLPSTPYPPQCPQRHFGKN